MCGVLARVQKAQLAPWRAIRDVHGAKEIVDARVARRPSAFKWRTAERALVRTRTTVADWECDLASASITQRMQSACGLALHAVTPELA